MKQGDITKHDVLPPKYNAFSAFLSVSYKNHGMISDIIANPIMIKNLRLLIIAKYSASVNIVKLC